MGEAGRTTDAIGALRRALQLNPNSIDAWQLLAEHLDMIGDTAGADRARAAHIKAATKDPRLMDAAAALVENNLPVAEVRLRTHLQSHPKDVAALRMLAEIAARLRRYADAQDLLEACLELAPSFDAARINYAVVLNRLGKPAEALPQIERLLAKDPRNPSHRSLRAAILANLGDYAESIVVYEAVLKEFPQQPKIWMSYGHSLKTERRIADAVSCLPSRDCAAADPGRGVLEPGESQDLSLFGCRYGRAMRRALAGTDLDDEDRLHFEFSLGKALEDAGAYEESFAHYAAGNAIRKKGHPYNADDTTKFVQRSKAYLYSRLLRRARGAGLAGAGPDFHRRLAPRRIDLARANSGEPSTGRGDHGTAGYSQDCHGDRAARRARARSDLRRPSPRCRLMSCGPSANSICPRRAPSARPTSRSSSTRCRTIASMCGSSI